MLFQDVKPGAAAPSAVSKGWWARRACFRLFPHLSQSAFCGTCCPKLAHISCPGVWGACEAGAGCPRGGLGRVRAGKLQLWNTLTQPETLVCRMSSGIFYKNIFIAWAPWGEVLILPERRKPVSCMKKSPPSPNIKTSKRESSFTELCRVIAGLYTNWMLNTHQGVWLTHVASFLHALAEGSIEIGLSEKSCPKRSDTECLGSSGVSQRIWYEGKLRQAKTGAQMWPQPWPLIENASLLVQPQADRHDLIQLFHSPCCMELTRTFAAPRGYKTFFIHPR